MGIWNALLSLVQNALEALHSGLEPLFGLAAWGWAIITLTLVMRVLLLPLAIKQTRSMRAMQELQPEIKALQKKYKLDKGVAKTDPAKAREMKAKLNEETMALYKERGANPAAGCLPLLAQAPIFFALFRVLRDFADLKDAPFYFLTNHITPVEIEGTSPAFGLGAAVRDAGWPGWLMIALMVGTMFFTQKQMMGRQPAANEQAVQTQKIMLYVMPVFLGFVSFGLPLGVMLYWITTNLWQVAQQWILFRDRQKQDVLAGTTTVVTKGKDGGKSGGKSAIQDAAAKGASNAKAKNAQKNVAKNVQGGKSGQKGAQGGKSGQKGAQGGKNGRPAANGRPSSKPSGSGSSTKGGGSSHLPKGRRTGKN